MKTPIVPTLTGEEQLAIHVLRTIALMGGEPISSKEAYDSWLQMDDQMRQIVWGTWHLLHNQNQN